MIRTREDHGQRPRALSGGRWLIWAAPLFFLVKGLLWLAIPLLEGLWVVE